MADGTFDYTTEDMAYLRHADQPLQLRLFKPRGRGPFPLVVDLHGGAWNKGDLGGCRTRDEVLVRAGLAVAALDFRQAADGYPSSLQDIHYAIRWLKANAEGLDLDPARVALSGQSSGGHLAALIAMRPGDPRYGALPLSGGSPVDARVRCLVRGEAVTTPPALWLQGTPDVVNDYHDPDSGQELNEPERFRNLYQQAGGALEIVRVPYDARLEPAASEPLAVFFLRHLA